MCVAARTFHLHAAHTVGAVRFELDGLLIGRLPEARPTAAGLELRVGAEELGAAARAAVRPGLFAVVILAGESAFGAFLASDLVLLGSERGFPIGFGFFEFFFGH